MRILIATGIYLPQLGGPAKYAKNLKDLWEKSGHEVVVKTFRLEHHLPSGLRHLYFFFKIIPQVFRADLIFALDTFSVGWPATLASRLFGKKIILRTGGDFLWEGYVERTGESVFWRNFYEDTKHRWSFKERIIFRMTRWTLRHVSALIFSTSWQKELFVRAYGLEEQKMFIVENYYGEKLPATPPVQKNFIAGTRKLKWKNLDILPKIFAEIKEATLDLANYEPDEFQNQLQKCYATILVSLGDISPNMILESIRYNKPFILTKENGLLDREGFREIALLVDPQDPKDIARQVRWLLDPKNYEEQVAKIANFNFTHSWREIAKEIMEIYNQI